MSGSLRELSKAIVASLNELDLSTDVRPEIPENLTNALSAYYRRHEKGDANDAGRLHDELNKLFKDGIITPNSSREALFGQILDFVGPILMLSKDKIKYWIDQMLVPALDSNGRLRIVVEDSKMFLLKMMTYDPYDTYGSLFGDDYLVELSRYLLDSLVQIAIGSKNLETRDDSSNGRENNSDENNSFLLSRQQIGYRQEASILLREFGDKRPTDLFDILDIYFIQPQFRIEILNFLSDFLETQPPHLFETHSSGLVDHLYICLLRDQSPVAINLASSVLVMLLPHICSIIGPTLPKIFAIYARLLYWDILYRNASDESLVSASQESSDGLQFGSTGTFDDVSSGSIAYGGGYYYYDNPEVSDSFVASKRVHPQIQTSAEWENLIGSTEEIESEKVNYSRLFTFIYGMYPIHFLTFLTNPERYFRLVSFRMPNVINFDIGDIALRSQIMSRRHLLHPNFFRYTFETELNDQSRWEVAGAAEDIAAFCITLDTGNMEMPDVPEPTVIFQGFHGQLDNETQLPFIPLEPSESYDVNIATPSKDTNLSRTGSLSYSPRYKPKSIAGSISSMNTAGEPSVVSPQLGSLQFQHRKVLDIEEILDNHKDINNRLPTEIKPGTNESTVSSVASKSKISSSPDNMINSRDGIASSTDMQARLDYLQRQLLMIRNELNFERYLKRLRLRNLRSLKEQYSLLQRDEANTQGIIIANKMLQGQISRMQSDRASEHATLSRRLQERTSYANELLQKNRDLRQKYVEWKHEEESVRGSLTSFKEEVDKLKSGFLEQRAEIENLERKLKDKQEETREIDQIRRENSAMKLKFNNLLVSDRVESTPQIHDQQVEFLNLHVAKLERRIKMLEEVSGNEKSSYEARIADLQTRLESVTVSH
ncbi:Hamartin protein-domain-containing protein [Lipomyces oligophaga]|uniref:Hamartin protein-domain-containing protein n=1 Tax=Lipomyces oligophaga TaxID=45792 RepID=UPI0034D017BF